MNLEDKKNLLGLKIKGFRKQNKYTQEKLSELLSMDISALSKIENGKCFPSVETICKMIEMLKIEMFDFLSFTNKKTQIQEEIVLEKVRQLSFKDKQKVLKIIEIIKN